MLKFWLRLYKEGKLLKDTVCDVDENLSPGKLLEEGLKICCYELDIPNPMILKKHVNDIRQYSLTRFLPIDFPEAVDFDKAEINLFDNAKKKNESL